MSSAVQYQGFSIKASTGAAAAFELFASLTEACRFGANIAEHMVETLGLETLVVVRISVTSDDPSGTMTIDKMGGLEQKPINRVRFRRTWQTGKGTIHASSINQEDKFGRHRPG